MPERLWTTRDYKPGDEAGILALRQATFGDVDKARLLPAVWRWQFVDNPAGHGYIRLADHDGQIVGQYAAIPTRFRFGEDGTERIFAMSCDTMTHPAYQRQGMFVRLAQELYDDLASRLGVTTVWGFPNPASHPGFVGKLGWFDIWRFPIYVKPIQSRSALARYVRSHAVAGVLGGVADRLYRLVTPRPREPRRCSIREITTFDDRFAGLWARHQRSAAVLQVRDPAYLRWRYCGVPMFEYRPFEVTVGNVLEGYFVLRLVTLFDLSFCALVDIFPCPMVDGGITREVLGFAELYAAAHEVAFLAVLLPPQHARHVTRFGFLTVPRAMDPRPWYFGCRCTTRDERILRDIHRWYVTYGESDIV